MHIAVLRPTHGDLRLCLHGQPGVCWGVKNVSCHPPPHGRDSTLLLRLACCAVSASSPPPCPSAAQSVHEHGGYGSVGYGYCWKRSEAQKNLLRTHTTAVSSRMLYKLAQEGFK